MHDTGNNYSLITASRKINFILPLFLKYNAPKLLAAGYILYTKEEKRLLIKWCWCKHIVLFLHN